MVYSPHSQILADLQTKLRDYPEWLSPSLIESWLRRYQVLPGRTHPLMNMSGSGGYLLHSIRVYASSLPLLSFTRFVDMSQV